MAAGQPIDAYHSPGADHDMLEIRSNPDGPRSPTRVTDGYLTLRCRSDQG